MWLVRCFCVHPEQAAAVPTAMRCAPSTAHVRQAVLLQRCCDRSCMRRLLSQASQGEARTPPPESRIRRHVFFRGDVWNTKLQRESSGAAWLRRGTRERTFATACGKNRKKKKTIMQNIALRSRPLHTIVQWWWKGNSHSVPFAKERPSPARDQCVFATTLSPATSVTFLAPPNCCTVQVAVAPESLRAANAHPWPRESIHSVAHRVHLLILRGHRTAPQRNRSVPAAKAP